METNLMSTLQPDRTKPWIAFEFNYDSEDFNLDDPLEILRKWVVDEVKHCETDGSSILSVEHGKAKAKEKAKDLVESIDASMTKNAIRSMVFDAVTGSMYLVIVNAIPWRLLDSGMSITERGVVDIDDYFRSWAGSHSREIPDLASFAADIWVITVVGHDAQQAVLFVRPDQLRHLDAKTFHMVQPFIKE